MGGYDVFRIAPTFRITITVGASVHMQRTQECSGLHNFLPVRLADLYPEKPGSSGNAYLIFYYGNATSDVLPGFLYLFSVSSPETVSMDRS